MNDEYIWEDWQRRRYIADELTDGYLINIIRFVSECSGYYPYTTKNNVIRLLNEAKLRGIELSSVLSDNCIFLFHYNYGIDIHSFDEVWLSTEENPSFIVSITDFI